MNVREVPVGSDVVADARRRFLAPVRICKGARTGSELLITGEDFANGLPTVEELPLRVAVISTVSPHVSPGFRSVSSTLPMRRVASVLVGKLNLTESFGLEVSLV